MGNKVLLSGRLASDPVVRSAGNDANSRQFMTLRLMTDEGYRDRESGEWVERSVGHDILINSPETIAYVLKWGWTGRWCEVETRLMYRERKEDGLGTGVYVVSLTASSISFPVRHDGSKEPDRNGGNGNDRVPSGNSRNNQRNSQTRGRQGRSAPPADQHFDDGPEF